MASIPVKYSPNEEVWVLHNKKVRNLPISNVRASWTSVDNRDEIMIKYTIYIIDHYIAFEEGEVFATKEELLNSL